MSNKSSGSGRQNYTRKHRPANFTSNKINNPTRSATPNGGRDRATINRIKMYNARAIHSRDGTFLGGQYMSRVVDEKAKRIAPDRRYFGNTRVVGQKELETFRTEMAEKVNDPYTVLMRSKQLPMGLLSSPYEKSKMDLLSTQSFESTFGAKKTRKKARVAGITDMNSLVEHTVNTAARYDEEKDVESNVHNQYIGGEREAKKEALFEKGASRRLWQELYKVLDSSDVVVQVLDARDPMGSRSKRIEDELKSKERRHKHLIFVLNKCDLIPTWATRRWVKVLSQEYPTLAFHASITNPFGKGSLIQLLRQFSSLHKEKKQISVGFVGYPNVGKSSVINTLRGKDVCKSAPIPGQTKVWQYITLFKRIFLIDCPGVVYPVGNTEEETVLKGVVRIDKLDDPGAFVAAVLKRCKPQYIKRTYGVDEWSDAIDFLSKVAVSTGKLLKHGEPDWNNAAKMILNDFQRGRIPYFVPPPFEDDKPEEGADASQIEQMFTKIAVRTKFLKEDMVEEKARAVMAGGGNGGVVGGVDPAQEHESSQLVRGSGSSATTADEDSSDGEDDDVDEGDDDAIAEGHSAVAKSGEAVPVQACFTALGDVVGGDGASTQMSKLAEFFKNTEHGGAGGKAKRKRRGGANKHNQKVPVVPEASGRTKKRRLRVDEREDYQDSRGRTIKLDARHRSGKKMKANGGDAGKRNPNVVLRKKKKIDSQTNHRSRRSMN